MLECLVYFAVFFVVFFINHAAMRQSDRRLRRWLIVIGFLILLIFIGFRYNVGTDYRSYLRIYNEASGMPWDKLSSVGIELPVAMLFKACSYVLWDPKLIFMVMAFLLLWPVYKVNSLYDNKYLAYSVLIFCILFLPFSLNGMRQGIAMGFVLLMFVYLAKGSIKGAVASFVVSILFHMSAVIVLPYAVFAYLHKLKKINFTVLSLCTTIFLSVLVLFFLNDWLSEIGFDSYAYILNKIDLSRMSFTNAMFYFPVLVVGLVFGRTKDKWDENKIFRDLVIAGFVFFVIGSTSPYLSRFALYFMMAAILLVPKLVQAIKEKRLRVLVKTLLILYFISFFYVQYSLLGWHEIMPYRTWLLEDFV